MEVQFKKNVRIICDLKIGDTVRVKGWGYKLDGKDWIITDLKYYSHCESAFMVMINGYESWIDSSWVDKVSK